ncbi:MAG: glycosyltransferase [Thaumarchaeota archaeon]|nr:glycosyltransferase [Nitrososphaerota archaeon]
MDGGILFVGNIYSPIQFSIPMQTQILFLIFFPSLAVSTRAAIKTRMKVLLFWPVCMIGLVLIQFLVIVTMMATGFTSSVAVLQASIVCTGIAGSLLIEASLFLTINLPTRAKLGTKIKRSHFDEYVIVGVLLSGAVILVYLVTNILNLQSNSPVTAYLAINLSSILLLRYYLAYFIYEIKVPKWAKSNQITVVRQNYDDTPLSFLLPAYNEEKHIRRCIESIDKAAANYLGNTEIVVVNDGSTDDTRKIASEAVLNLKHASGKVYNIPNSGKGHALQYGLDRISGDIVFRIDTDSAIDKHAITRVMCHFKDPDVGSVSGLILPLEEKSWIQKIWVLRYALLTFYKREWELIDAALVQPGAFSVFRRDALVNVGGWADDILGEDGDITIKLARCGYRNQYEQHAIVFSDIPSNLKDLREQRVRWSMSFYHARATNLDVIKEADGPISIMYALSILDVGSNYAAALYLPFLIATLITGHESFLNLGILLGVPVGLLTIEFLTYGLQTLVHVYFLFKFKKLYILKYIPASRFYDFIYTVFIAPEALEILLSVSSKWKAKHTKDLTKALRKKIKEGIGST